MYYKYLPCQILSHDWLESDFLNYEFSILSLAMAYEPSAKYFPIRPDLTRSISILLYHYSTFPFIPFFLLWGAGMAQRWEHSPPTNVARVRFPDLASYNLWVEFVGSLLRTERFSPISLLKNHHLTWFVLIVNLSLQCPQLVLQR